MKIMPLLIIFLLIPIVNAQVEEYDINTTTYCYNNNTLATKIQKVVCIEDRCDNVTRFEKQPCPMGCDSELNRCNPSTWQKYLIWVGIIVGVIILVIIINWIIHKVEWFGVSR